MAEKVMIYKIPNSPLLIVLEAVKLFGHCQSEMGGHIRESQQSEQDLNERKISKVNSILLNNP